MKNKSLIVGLVFLMVISLGSLSALAYGTNDILFGGGWSGSGSGHSNFLVNVKRTGSTYGDVEYEYDANWGGGSSGVVGTSAGAGLLSENFRDSDIMTKVTGVGQLKDDTRYAMNDIGNDNEGTNLNSNHYVNIITTSRGSYDVRDRVITVDDQGFSGKGDDVFVHSQGFGAKDVVFYYQDFAGDASVAGTDPCSDFNDPIGYDQSSSNPSVFISQSYTGHMILPVQADTFDLYARTWQPYGRGSFDRFEAGTGSSGMFPPKGARNYDALVEGSTGGYSGGWVGDYFQGNLEWDH